MGGPSRFERPFEDFAEFEVIGDRDALDVGIIRMVFDIFLVIVFGGVEHGEGDYLGDDLCGIFFRGG